MRILLSSGQPGSGKTVALASLATQIARADPYIGKLAEFTPIFVHPVIMGYLAGQAIKELQQIMDLAKHLAWVGKTLGLHYAATCNDLSVVVNALLGSDKDDPLNHNLFMVSRWLRDIPSNNFWHSQVMRQLVDVVKRESYPLSLRARGLAAILASNDTSVIVLFRKLIISNYTVVRLLAALGCGALRDVKSINDLIEMLADPEQSVRLAAGLALIALDSPTALVSSKEAVIGGDENLGRIVAISLAAHPPDGKTVLQDWSQDENLLLRRACVFGLESIRERWAEEALEKMSIEDGARFCKQARHRDFPRSARDPHPGLGSGK
jgi:hypothetical protein